MVIDLVDSRKTTWRVEVYSSNRRSVWFNRIHPNTPKNDHAITVHMPIIESEGTRGRTRARQRRKIEPESTNRSCKAHEIITSINIKGGTVEKGH